jgi:cobalt transporter subunit CbtA
MDRFRHLIGMALLAGAAAGLVLFAIQHWTVIPLIDQAELHEAAHHAMAGMAHEDEGWQPAPGFQRTALTALSTMLSGIGFAAVLLAVMALNETPAGARRGALWGLAGFACFVLAPALGLPPELPGAAVADLHARQVWWIATVAATALGLGLLAGRQRSWLARAAGVACLILPHAIGAPATDEASLVSPELMHQFAVASIATNAVFWLLLGTLCGSLLGRRDAVPAASGAG